MGDSAGVVTGGEMRAGAAAAAEVYARDGGARPGASSWSPLRYPAFRALWLATLAANVGTWMQQVGAAGLLTGLRHRLSRVGEAALEPALHWDAPRVAAEFGTLAREGEGRAAMVTVEYYIDPRREAGFREAMRGVRAERMRHGATYWGLFADASDPSRWVEFFAQPSWTEHLRQHERVTQEDRDVEARALAFHILAEPPRATHYVGGPHE